MKVLYDHQAFTYQNFGGVSKCFCETISCLPTNVESFLSLSRNTNIHLVNSKLAKFVYPTFFINNEFMRRQVLFWETVYNWLSNKKIVKNRELINREKSIKAICSLDYDVFHPTYFDDYFLPYIKKPFVITIHDMIRELFMDCNSDESRRKKILAEKAAAIIAVSENTKKDIIRLFGIDEKKIFVVHHGGPTKRNKINRIEGMPVKYFLYMGNRSGYKNGKQFLIDFSKFMHLHNDIMLVMTGPEFSMEELTLINKLDIHERIIHKFVPDKDLPSLYANALAFIFPSLYEGFGMPILEAFSYGCPVILNNKSCFHEIAGDAALYFDEDGGINSDLPEKLDNFINYNQNDLDNMIKKGYERLSHFSWLKAAEEMGEVYKYAIETFQK